MDPKTRTQASSRRGSFNVFAAVSIPLVLGGLAVGTDIWTVVSAHRQLQDAVDATAIAGASSAPNQTEANRRAVTNFKMNPLRSDMAAKGIATAVGRYRNGRFDPSSDLRNAVQVQGDAVVRTTFGQLVGLSEVPVSAQATAWYAPFDCQVFVDSVAFLRGSIEGDGWNSCNEGSYTGPTEEIAFCANGDIDFRGAGTYDGDMNVGGTLTVGGRASFTGTSNTIPYDIEFPDYGPDIAAARVRNDNRGLPYNLNLTGGIQEIGPGTYYFNNARLAGNAAVVLVPPVDIYIDGDVHVGGNAQWITKNPTVDQVNLYVADGRSLDLRGQFELYGTLLAPGASVDIAGGAQFYGLFMAGDLKVRGNAEFHTDACLDFEDYGLRISEQSTAPVLVEPR